MASKAPKLERIDYVLDYGKRSKVTRKPARRKPTRADLEAYADLLERHQTASDEIRARAGLEPVPPNFVRQALAVALETTAAKPAATKPKTKAEGIDWRALATAALELLDMKAPTTAADVPQLLEAIS